MERGQLPGDDCGAAVHDGGPVVARIPDVRGAAGAMDAPSDGSSTVLARWGGRDSPGWASSWPQTGNEGG